MADTTTGLRDLKRKVLRLLEADDLSDGLEQLARIPPRQAVNPLIALLMHKDERIRLRAVTALGRTIKGLADTDREFARVVMRRLMWSLNDESGGIGWGSPETMAEAVVQHEVIAEEYGRVFVSYLNETGNFLEYELLQRSLLRGVVRIAESRPEVLKDAVPHLLKYLGSADAEVRGLAVWALGILGAAEARDELVRLLGDSSEITRYKEDDFIRRTVGDLAGEALERTERHGRG